MVSYKEISFKQSSKNQPEHHRIRLFELFSEMISQFSFIEKKVLKFFSCLEFFFIKKISTSLTQKELVTEFL